MDPTRWRVTEGDRTIFTTHDERRAHWWAATRLATDPASDPKVVPPTVSANADRTIQLIASTQFHGIDVGSAFEVPDTPDGGSAVAEVAGRACYQSWTRPNPRTATNAGYLAHILEVGHGSVLEHATATFYLQGISRSLTHELIRHRHLNYSQLSQRYVDGSTSAMVVPPLITEASFARPAIGELFDAAARDARRAYKDLASALQGYLIDTRPELTGTARRKAAREAARGVLPNATETRLVVTGNYRAWRDVIAVRATEHADAEIRAGILDILSLLQGLAPNVFGDFQVRDRGHGFLTAYTDTPA